MSTSRRLIVHFATYTVLMIARECGAGCVTCLNGGTPQSNCSCLCAEPWFGLDCDSAESPANLTFMKGTIRSPGYRTGRYRNRELFDWFISPAHARSSAIIQITVVNMDLESGYDYVGIFTDPPVNSKPIATLTGVSMDLQLISRPPLGLRFITDDSRVYRGFEINYTVINGFTPPGPTSTPGTRPYFGTASDPRNGTDACASTNKCANCVGYAVPVVSALLTGIFTAGAAIALTYFCLARRAREQASETEKREGSGQANIHTSQSSDSVYLRPIQHVSLQLEGHNLKPAELKVAEAQQYPEVEPYEYVEPCNPTSNQETESVDGYVPMTPSPRLEVQPEDGTASRQLTVQYQSLTGRYASLPYDKPVPL